MKVIPPMKDELRLLAECLRDLVDVVSINASENDLMSFPAFDRQIERADKVRVKVDALRKKLAESLG